MKRNFLIGHNVFVYGLLRWLATKLVKENEPEEIPACHAKAWRNFQVGLH
jgi:hypothetical protein